MNSKVWLSVLTESYVPIISNALLNLGYNIGPIKSDSLVNNCCLAYNIQHETKNNYELEKDLNDIITKYNLLIHMRLVICEEIARSSYLWRGSNINYNCKPATNDNFKEELINSQETDILMKNINHLLFPVKRNGESKDI